MIFTLKPLSFVFLKHFLSARKQHSKKGHVMNELSDVVKPDAPYTTVAGNEQNNRADGPSKTFARVIYQSLLSLCFPQLIIVLEIGRICIFIFLWRSCVFDDQRSMNIMAGYGMFYPKQHTFMLKINLLWMNLCMYIIQLLMKFKHALDLIRRWCGIICFGFGKWKNLFLSVVSVCLPVCLQNISTHSIPSIRLKLHKSDKEILQKQLIEWCSATYMYKKRMLLQILFS